MSFHGLYSHTVTLCDEDIESVLFRNINNCTLPVGRSGRCLEILVRYQTGVPHKFVQRSRLRHRAHIKSCIFCAANTQRVLIVWEHFLELSTVGVLPGSDRTEERVRVMVGMALL